MNYNHVNGPIPRYWRVRQNPANSNLDLQEGDLLVFDGTAPSTITKFRPVLPGNRQNAPEQWADTCSSPSNNPQNSFTIHGTQKKFGEAFTITFTAGTNGVAAFHVGNCPNLPASTSDSLIDNTWMADEGP